MSDPFVLSVLSAAVYEDPAEERFLAFEVNYVPRLRLDYRDTQATLFLAKDFNGPPVLAFRGTEFLKSWRDFLNNIGWSGKWAGPGRAHRGYARAYSAITTEVVHLAETYPGLVFTGHSLGGALASLACVHIAGLTDQQIRTVTFGAPPCLGFFSGPPSQVERYTIANDFAPMIPGWMVGLGHPGKKRCKLTREGPLPISIRAHEVTIYMDRLEDGWRHRQDSRKGMVTS